MSGKLPVSGIVFHSLNKFTCTKDDLQDCVETTTRFLVLRTKVVFTSFCVPHLTDPFFHIQSTTLNNIV